MIKLVVFDFDGTLADTLQMLYEIANGLNSRYGFAKIEALDELQNLTPNEVIRNLRIKKYKIPFLVRRILISMEDRVDEVCLFPGILAMLDDLSKDYKLGLLTSNRKKNVMHILDRYHLLEKFSFIYTGSSLFGKHRKMRRILRKYRLTAKEVLYVGDEVRDIAASKKAGIPIISVTWGYNKEDILSKNNPDYLAHRPKDIPRIVRGFH